MYVRNGEFTRRKTTDGGMCFNFHTRIVDRLLWIKVCHQMNLTTFSATHHESITKRSAVNSDQLLAMRHTENGKPLFCIHPSGGDIGVYRKFAARTTPALSVYGIQSRLQCGATSEFSSLSRMAFEYADLINDNQPMGDIRLLGFSLGGFLASLMAVELQQLGRTVSFLGLIDSNPNWTVATDTSRQELCLRLTQVFTKFCLLYTSPSPRD